MKKEAEPKEWPKTPAFQDEDTREMLDSTEEVQDGYYLYTSKTGGYSMLWPVDAIKHSYQNNGDSYEKIIFGASNKRENYTYEISTTYENASPEHLIDSFLSILSSSLQYSGEYEEIKESNKTLFFAQEKDTLESTDGRRGTYYSYFGYIRDNVTEQGVRYIYTVSCYDDENVKECNIDESKEKERTLMLMKSVNFSKVDLEGE
ncbi:hypothetical protein [Metabacillus malikii]|uniref:Lipoprotein YvcA n=1 Tax=Metabacillus malikii TaxID=1504265 RepID=A0ABT9ZG20_9BACI|nr:hypothetical protein [Metabacillus malikii]MDQ0231211.1 hypothetical protein [Metabacillus malikii]